MLYFVKTSDRRRVNANHIAQVEDDHPGGRLILSTVDATGDPDFVRVTDQERWADICKALDTISLMERRRLRVEATERGTSATR